MVKGDGSLKISVLDVSIDAVTMIEAVSKLETFIEKKQPRLVATANAEMVMLAQEDSQLAAVLAGADLIVPDGSGVVWAGRYLGQSVPERVAGYDLSQCLLQKAATKGYGVYFFGGAPGIVQIAKKNAEIYYPGLRIVGTRDGYFGSADELEIINTIKASGADILFVGLGVPKQEKWLAAHLAELNVPVAIGVGGTFDVMAGTVRRAPVWMQRAGLEWLFRLLCQPKRLIRMLALPRFMLKVLRTKKH